jgi:transcriptional regulator with XRE-family HTH domain
MKYQELNDFITCKGITKHKLAIESGINPSALYDALNGVRPFYPSYKTRIAKFLEVDEDYLFSEEEQT